LTAASNPLERLIAFCARHENDPDAQWIEAACWSHMRGEGAFDACLGIRNPLGGGTWRDRLRSRRRDDLIRCLYIEHFRALSLHAACWKIARDLALFRYRVWPKIMFDEMPHSYTGRPMQTYFRLMAEGHDVPGPRQLFNILRKAVLLPVSNDGVLTSPNGDRSNQVRETERGAIDPPRPVARSASTG
jgi:hypothetical protein